VNVATQERSAHVPVLEVVGGPGRLSRESLHELWHFREVLWAFVLRQIKVRYKQAAVGIGWAVIQPVLAALAFALFLFRYSSVPSEGVPALLFTLAGMAGWSYFSSATALASESLVTNQALLRKIYFPREVLPLSAVLAGVLDLMLGVGVLVLVTFAYGIGPALSWVALPLPLVLFVIAAAAFGHFLSAINVYYRDVRYALPFVLQLGLFVSPIAYPLGVVPSSWRTPYAILNPVAAAADSLRRIVVHGEWPDFPILLASLGWSSFVFLCSYAFFKRLERGFSDRA
jgi:homopolymeric O-antigen transport system permease protein